MEMMIFMGIPVLIYEIAIIYIAVKLMIVKNKVKQNGSRLVFAELIFTIIGPIIGFLRYDEYGPDIPFSPKHVISIVVIVIVSSMSLWISRLFFNRCSQFQKYILSIGILQGMVLCIITSIHFIPRLGDGLVFPIFGFEMMSPVIAFFLLLKEFIRITKETVEIKEPITYHEKFMNQNLMQFTTRHILNHRALFYPILLMIFIIIQIYISQIFGQKVDSIIRAFTESIGFIFSCESYLHTSSWI